MYTIKDYNPPKPFFMMSIQELVKYNKHCIKVDKYLLYKSSKKNKHRRTKNRKNRKTRRNLSKSEKLKMES